MLYWWSLRYPKTQEILQEPVRRWGLIFIWSAFGFSVEDRYLKRAGLDYWDKVNIKYYDSFSELRDNIRSTFFIIQPQKHKSYTPM